MPLFLKGVLEYLGKLAATAVEGHLLLTGPGILGELQPRTLVVDGTNEGRNFFLEGFDRGLQGPFLELFLEIVHWIPPVREFILT